MTLSVSLADSERALDKAINGLRNEDPGRSASVAILGWQRAVIWTVLVITIGFGIWRPMQTAVALIGLCTLGYVLTMLDRRRSRHRITLGADKAYDVGARPREVLADKGYDADDLRLLGLGQYRGSRLRRPGLHILDRRQLRRKRPG